MFIFDLFGKRKETKQEINIEEQRREEMLHDPTARALNLIQCSIEQTAAGDAQREKELEAFYAVIEEEAALQFAQFQPELNGTEEVLVDFAEPEKPADPAEPEAGSQDETEAGPDVPAQDAKILIHISEDAMEAYACILPAVNGGSDISENRLLDEVRYAGITNGIRRHTISDLVSRQLYLQTILIACGTPPEDGADGSIVPRYELKEAEPLEIEADNELAEPDFSAYDRMQLIRKGQIICQIEPATAAQDGKNVFGHILHGKDGVPAKIPQGDYTEVSKDGRRLMAVTDGIVVAQGENFSVKKLRIVTSQVNQQTGGLDVGGDLFIRGDITGGVSIRAHGNVMIDGTVRKAKITSGGTIRIRGEVKGLKETRLKADGQVQCMVIEDAVVEAEGDIYAETVFNSEMTSMSGSIHVTTGRGLVLGGTLRARHSIFAKTIGNLSGNINHMVLGYCPQLEQEFEEKREAYQNSRELHEKLKSAVSSMAASGKNRLREMQDVWKKLKEQQELYEKIEKEGRLEVLNLEKQKDALSRGGRISCEKLYPITRVQIGKQEITIQTERNQCTISLPEGQSEHIYVGGEEVQ